MKDNLTVFVLLGSILLSPLSSAAEVLGHISDDTESVVSESEAPQNKDRRIIYRVICTPGGEALPDCERPLDDTETPPKPLEAEPLEEDSPVIEGEKPSRSD